MANDLTTYPLQVDTAFTSGLTTPVLIRMMVWTGGTTAGHTVTVTAVNSAGVESPHSAPISITTKSK